MHLSHNPLTINSQDKSDGDYRPEHDEEDEHYEEDEYATGSEEEEQVGGGCAPSQSAKDSHKVAKRHNGSH